MPDNSASFHSSNTFLRRNLWRDSPAKHRLYPIGVVPYDDSLLDLRDSIPTTCSWKILNGVDRVVWPASTVLLAVTCPILGGML